MSSQHACIKAESAHCPPSPRTPTVQERDGVCGYCAPSGALVACLPARTRKGRCPGRSRPHPPPQGGAAEVGNSSKAQTGRQATSKVKPKPKPRSRSNRTSLRLVRLNHGHPSPEPLAFPPTFPAPPPNPRRARPEVRLRWPPPTAATTNGGGPQPARNNRPRRPKPTSLRERDHEKRRPATTSASMVVPSVLQYVARRCTRCWEHRLRVCELNESRQR